MTKDKCLKEKIWLPEEGEPRHLSEMSTLHLLNSLKRCIREHWRVEFIPLLQEELEFRGCKDSHPELFI